MANPKAINRMVIKFIESLSPRTSIIAKDYPPSGGACLLPLQAEGKQTPREKMIIGLFSEQS